MGDELACNFFCSVDNVLEAIAVVGVWKDSTYLACWSVATGAGVVFEGSWGVCSRDHGGGL